MNMDFLNVSDTNIILETYGLSKKYHGKTVLEDINFQLEKGSFCALLGENGAGKSTLLNILMGQEYSDRGTGKVLNISLDKDLSFQKNQIGLVTEKLDYDVPLSVGKFFDRYSEFFDNWDNELFLQLMNDRKLELSRNFSEFSRGQKMQIALISALAIRPTLLLIDEITSVLDIYARKFFIEILKKFTKEGGTVLITTNIISEIEYATDRIIILDKGKICLNENVNDIPSKFIKIRNASHQDHPIFKHEGCFWSGNNSDGSSSFIVPCNVASQFQLPDEILDKRSITLDEIFIYFIKTGDDRSA